MINNIAIANINYNSMSDKDLILRSRNKDSRAIEALYSRNQKFIKKCAACSFKDHPFIYNAYYRDIEDDVLSEAYIAFNKAVEDYDFASSAFSSHIANCISFRFQDLWRKNAKHVHRAPSLNDYAHKYSNDKASDEQHAIDMLQQDEADDKQDAVNRYAEVKSAHSRMVSYFKNDSNEKKVLDLLLNDIKDSDSVSISNLAKQIHRSRQQAYNILNRIKAKVPEPAAKEIKNLF